MNPEELKAYKNQKWTWSRTNSKP